VSTPLSGIGGVAGRLSVGGIGGDTGMRPLSIGGGTGNGLSFGDTLKQALNEVSGMQDKSSDAIASFLRGEPIELHQVMAASEEAGIALDALIEIRNKLTDAYRSVMNMQS
jgi:flagellar hook-basal body complex protein FliE